MTQRRVTGLYSDTCLSIITMIFLVGFAGCGSTYTDSAPAMPQVSITANPTSIEPGNTSVLTMTASDATVVTVSGTDGSTYTLLPTGASKTVSPAATTTYTAVALGTNGKASANVIVAVNKPPTVSLTPSPSSVTAGDSAALEVVAANASNVEITGSDGSTYSLQNTGGTQVVSRRSGNYLLFVRVSG